MWRDFEKIAKLIASHKIKHLATHGFKVRVKGFKSSNITLHGAYDDETAKVIWHGSRDTSFTFTQLEAFIIDEKYEQKVLPLIFSSD